MEPERREAVYGREAYYWGREPSSLAQRTAEHLGDGATGQRLIDLGAGEGRDAVFFAERGLDVFAVDVSPAGLEKAQRLAAERDVTISPIRADLNAFACPEPMDVVFSSGTLQFIHPDVRDRQLTRFQAATRPGGLHAVFAFVDHPEIPPAPDSTDDQYPFDRDELQGYYTDWKTIHSEERIFEDDSGGVAHRHAARVHLARKPA